MVLTFVDPEITGIRQLREFVGLDAIARFDARHPLAPLRYLTKPEEMHSIEHVAEMYELEFAARAVFHYLIGSCPDDRLLYDLKSAKDCRALLFEAMVLTELIQPYVGAVCWRRYEEAKSDIFAENPKMQIECTRLQRYSFDAMVRAAEAKLGQKNAGEGLYLIVVGTQEARTPHIFHDITSPIRRRLDRWMRSHPEASAFHLVAPRKMAEAERVAEDEEGFSLRVAPFFGVTVRNQAAQDPLPPGFEQNWAIAP